MLFLIFRYLILGESRGEKLGPRAESPVNSPSKLIKVADEIASNIADRTEAKFERVTSIAIDSYSLIYEFWRVGKNRIVCVNKQLS